MIEHHPRGAEAAAGMADQMKRPGFQQAQKAREMPGGGGHGVIVVACRIVCGALTQAIHRDHTELSGEAWQRQIEIVRARARRSVAHRAAVNQNDRLARAGLEIARPHAVDVNPTLPDVLRKHGAFQTDFRLGPERNLRKPTPLLSAMA